MSEIKEITNKQENKKPVVQVEDMLKYIGISIISIGIILSVVLLVEADTYNTPETVKYYLRIRAGICFIVSILSCTMFFAINKVIVLLSEIRDSLNKIKFP